MNYDNQILAYEDDAEDRYDDYHGDYYEDDFDSGFEGMDQEYEEAYDNYASSSIGRIDPNDRTLTFVVKNASGADVEAVLFGANEELPAPAGVTIECEESSHKEVREESKANPFLIDGMKMSVSDPLQFDNVLRIVNRTASGKNTSGVFQPRNATSPQNFSANLIDSDFSMEVTGQSSLRFSIKDGVTVVFTFTIKARANMGNLLKGRNVAEISTVPRTTGLPQIDLMHRKTKPVLGLRPKRRKPKLVRRGR